MPTDDDLMFLGFLLLVIGIVLGNWAAYLDIRRQDRKRFEQIRKAKG